MKPSVLLLILGTSLAIDPQEFTLSLEKSCPIDIPLSCSNSTPVQNSCCFEYPGGVLLQTQFWDYYPAIGPDDMFTLHGLWPDNCDGSYEQFCGPSKDYIHQPRQILEAAGEEELLAEMDRVWKNFNGNDASLWEHEYNKHATCMSTLKSSCYDQSSFTENQNVVDFFNISVNLFKTLPTFQWLANNGIVPSTEQTYSKKQVEDTLRAQFSQPVFIKCNKYSALQEVWYFHHVKGSVLSEEFTPIPALDESKCPETGIKFLPKDFTPPTPTRIPGPKPTGVGRRGVIKLTNQQGCLITTGEWYASGTCATFTVLKAPYGGYNLKSSKGWCGIDDMGDLSCNRQMMPMQFQLEKEGDYLFYGGKKTWSTDKYPSKFQKSRIHPGKDGDYVFKLKFEGN